MATEDTSIGLTAGQLMALLADLPSDTPIMVPYAGVECAQPAAATLSRIVTGAQTNYVGMAYYHIADPAHWFIPATVTEAVVVLHGAQNADDAPVSEAAIQSSERA